MRLALSCLDALVNAQNEVKTSEESLSPALSQRERGKAVTQCALTGLRR